MYLCVNVCVCAGHHEKGGKYLKNGKKVNNAIYVDESRGLQDYQEEGDK